MANRGGMPRKWRTDGRIMARLEQVERLRLKGWSNIRIARALKVAEGTVRNDVDRIEDLWCDRVAASLVEQRGRTVAQLGEIVRQALEACEFHGKVIRSALFDVEVDLDGAKMSFANAPEARRGAASHAATQQIDALDVARRAVVDQARILGLITEKVARSDSLGDDLASLAMRARAAREAAGRNRPELKLACQVALPKVLEVLEGHRRCMSVHSETVVSHSEGLAKDRHEFNIAARSICGQLERVVNDLGAAVEAHNLAARANCEFIEAHRAGMAELAELRALVTLLVQREGLNVPASSKQAH